MKFATLTYSPPNSTASTEKQLKHWGVVYGYSYSKANKSVGTLEFQTTEMFCPTAPLQFAFEGKLTLRLNRESATGDPGTFSGGTVVFVGWVDDPERVSAGGRENVRYRAHDLWWLMERNQFKQQRAIFKGWSTPGDPESVAVTEQTVLTEVYLGQDGNEQRQTNGAQVEEVVRWINEIYNPTRRGSGGGDAGQDIAVLGAVGPSVIMPVQRMGACDCAEAILASLRWSPDAAMAIDDASGKPTVTVTKLDDMEEVEVSVSDAVISEVSASPNNMMRVPGVWIDYKRVDTVDGSSANSFYFDRYPDTITRWTPGVRTLFVELSGSNLTRVTANVSTYDLAPALTGTNDQRASWWKSAGARQLLDPTVKPGSVRITAASVEDESGADVTALSGTYPRVLSPAGAPLASWMNVGGVPVTVRAKVSYEKYADDDLKVFSDVVEGEDIFVSVIITDAQTRAYSATASYAPGEDVPPLWPDAGSLAKAVYDATHNVQHAGTVTLVGNQVDLGVAVGKKLKLVGRNTTFSGLMIQSIQCTPDRGEVRVTFGPLAPLDAPDLIELYRATKWRTLYSMPSGRSTGLFTSGATVETGNKTPKQDGGKSHGRRAKFAAVGDAEEVGGARPTIQLAPQGATGASQPVTWLGYVDTDGNKVSDRPQVEIDAGKLADAGNLKAEFQEFTDASGSKQYVLATAPFSGGGAFTVRASSATRNRLEVRGGNIWIPIFSTSDTTPRQFLQYGDPVPDNQGIRLVTVEDATIDIPQGFSAGAYVVRLRASTQTVEPAAGTTDVLIEGGAYFDTNVPPGVIFTENGRYADLYLVLAVVTATGLDTDGYMSGVSVEQVASSVQSRHFYPQGRVRGIWQPTGIYFPGDVVYDAGSIATSPGGWFMWPGWANVGSGGGGSAMGSYCCVNLCPTGDTENGWTESMTNWIRIK